MAPTGVNMDGEHAMASELQVQMSAGGLEVPRQCLCDESVMACGAPALCQTQPVETAHGRGLQEEKGPRIWYLHSQGAH